MSIDIWITYESIVHSNTCSFLFQHILGFPKDLTVKNLTPTTASMIITDWRWRTDVHRKVGNGRYSIIDTSLTYYHVVIWTHHITLHHLHHVWYVAISFLCMGHIIVYCIPFTLLLENVLLDKLPSQELTNILLPAGTNLSQWLFLVLLIGGIGTI